MRCIWKNRWFILVAMIALFSMVSYSKIALAGTDVQLDRILKSGLDGLTEYFKFLLDVLNKVW